jgi:hypothetical protein
MRIEELCNLYSLQNNIRVIKSRGMRRAGYVAHMGDRRGAYRVLVGKSKGERSFEMATRQMEGNIKLRSSGKRM